MHAWQSYTFRSIFNNHVNLVWFGSSAQGFMTIQVGPFSALKHVMHQFKQNLCFQQIVWSLYSSIHSSHRCISHQQNISQLNHLTTPLCSGIFGCWVDIPARKQVEPRRLAHRTLTKSLGPTTFPGVSADTSWVTIVSWPIFWRIFGNPLWNLFFLIYCITFTGSLVILQPLPSLSYLDLFDVRVPVPHLLHISHQLFVQCVRMLLQHYFQLEHLPNVRQCLTQDFVSIGLRKSVGEGLEVFTYALSQLSG